MGLCPKPRFILFYTKKNGTKKKFPPRRVPGGSSTNLQGVNENSSRSLGTQTLINSFSFRLVSSPELFKGGPIPESSLKQSKKCPGFPASKLFPPFSLFPLSHFRASSLTNFYTAALRNCHLLSLNTMKFLMTADRMIIAIEIIREKTKASTGHQPASLPWIMDARSFKDCITLMMTASANVLLL
jgi:hypothetical protein